MQSVEHQGKSITYMIVERKTSYHLPGKLNSRVLDFDIDRISSSTLTKKCINPTAYLD